LRGVRADMSIFLILGIMLVVVVASAALVLRHYYRRFPIHLIYRSKIHLQWAFDSIKGPLAIIDRAYQIQRVNRAYASLVARRFPDIIGSKCFAVLRGRDTPCTDCRMVEVLEKNADLVTERSPHPRYPDTGAVSLTFHPFLKSKSRGERAIVEHIRDITHLERLKRDLEIQNITLTETTRSLEKERERTREELELARQIQLGIMPQKLPEINGLKIAATYHPVEEVGGDLYDFITFSDQKLGVFIGDASGHGLASAFVATMSKMTLYTHTRTELSPAELLKRLNRDLIDNMRIGHYITAFWGIIDLAERTITYARAGHPSPVIINPAKTITPLKSAGTFLGIIDHPVYEERTVRIEKGDRIYFFTDGIYEVMEGDAEVRTGVLGYRQFQEILASCSGLAFDNVISTIKQQLSLFTYDDDYTLIVVEVESESPPSPAA